MTAPKRIKPDWPCETCSHEKMVHKTLSKGQNAGACAIAGCRCRKYLPLPTPSRVRRGPPPLKQLGEQLRFYELKE